MNLRHLAARFLTPGWRKFSRRHAGETCYIFGDGPSIKCFDLAQFTRYPAICCGVIPFHRDFHLLRARYVSVVEPWLFAPKILQPRWLHAFRALASEYRKFFVANRDKEFFVNLSNRPWIRGDNINFVFRGLPSIRNHTDAELGAIDLFAGSFHASLTLAYYLGFTTVYLVGFDAWTLLPTRNLRWYEYGEGVVSRTVPAPTNFLQIVKNEMDIAVIAPGSAARDVRLVDYEEHTGKPLKYRENYELLEEHYLKVMDGCALYNIYDSSASATNQS